jgi:peptidoglycan/xylan/chitin deacetylase (PgdA/CDA1 family)
MTRVSKLAVGVLLLALSVSARAQRTPRQIAVTFDDLPMNTRAYADNVPEQSRTTSKLIAAIARHHVPAIGFVNEGKLAPAGRVVDPRRVSLLQQWLSAGLELGNHSYSHLDLHGTDLPTFEADVARGDSVTRSLAARAGRPAPHWFRHPFLHTGRDTADRARFERFLAERGYRVAPVTVDNYDYLFAAAYEKTLTAGDSVMARRIAGDYLDYMTRVFAFYERQSAELLGREIPQVLLLHATRLNADTFDRLASVLEKRGYSFVPIERAVNDTAYGLPDNYAGPAGITWIHRWALTQGKRGAAFAGEPEVPDYIAKLASLRQN